MQELIFISLVFFDIGGDGLDLPAPMPGRTFAIAYATAKAGVLGFTKSVSSSIETRNLSL